MDNLRLCRICVTQSESPVMMSIFGKDALWKKITSFANVHIEEGDNLPQQICLVCAKNAIDACLFKQKCEEADSFFRKQLLKRMELRLPLDTEIISISSGTMMGMMNGLPGLGGHGRDDGVATRIAMKNEDNNPIASSAMQQQQQQQLQQHQQQLQQQQQQLHQQQQQQNNQNIDDDDDDYDEDNFPILMEDTPEELSNDEQNEWNCDNMSGHNGDGSMDDRFDDNLPLIPEIELITPNEDDEDSTRRDINEYQCNVCFKCFAMKSILKHHVKNCHPETNPQYECYECKKTYLSKRFLEKHIRLGRCVKKRKNTTRPMQCSECRLLFPTGHHLGWHKRTGSCRSRSPKLSLIEYEQKNDSETNEENENCDNESSSPMNSSKEKQRRLGKIKTRGGRTRIKLDAKKIAYAKELVKQQVSTTKFAQELKISRTFAWRLRKTLENNMYKEGSWIPITPTAVAATVPLPRVTSTLSKASSSTVATTTKPNSIPNQEVFNKEAPIQINPIINTNTINPMNINSVLKTDNLVDMKEEQYRILENKYNEYIKSILIQQQQQRTINDPLLEFYQHQMMLLQAASSIAEMNKIFQKNDMTPFTNGKLDNQFPYHQMQATTTSAITTTTTEEIDEKSTAKTSEIKKESSEQQKQQQQQGKHEDDEEDGNDDENSDTDEVEANESQTSDGANHQQPDNSVALNDNKKRNKLRKKKRYQANINYSSTRYRKKPRKPNVFIDEEKYAQAKILVENNASTMEIAKTLNVSQMSAWKLRDCILKNIPLTFRKPQQQLSALIPTTTPQQLPKALVMTTKPAASTITSSATSSSSSLLKTQKLNTKAKILNKPKMKVPRTRLKRDERVKRDKIITKEILSLIKEDNNIQYWKVSERLAEKGFSLSPSSVCQRLKSMGIHRRLRPNDRNNQYNYDLNNKDDDNDNENDDDNSTPDDDDNDNDNDEQNDNDYSSINLDDHTHFLNTHFKNLA